MVSNKRIKHLLVADEVDSDSIDRQMDDGNKDVAVCIKNANFAWESGKNATPILKDINLEVKTNKLIAITGRVGSGKPMESTTYPNELNYFKANRPF